jgi:hypothetical protein
MLSLRYELSLRKLLEDQMINSEFPAIYSISDLHTIYTDFNFPEQNYLNRLGNWNSLTL